MLLDVPESEGDGVDGIADRDLLWRGWTNDANASVISGQHALSA
jgi:hypothetical protein